MMVYFRDTDPRPLPEPARRPVSQHYARAVERTGAELDEVVFPPSMKPAAPEGYAKAVAEANRRAASAYPYDTGRDAPALRVGFVEGYLTAWLSARS
jgi:hypothetical protein